MASKGIKNVYGGATINEGRFDNPDDIAKIYDMLLKGDVHVLDTAALYGKSEELIGKTGGPSKFTVDTKMRGGFPGAGHASKENVISEAENSKKMLGADVDIYYIHAPDSGTDIAETLAGINEVYKKGFFKRFGLSNYKAEDVQKVYDHCKEKGYPLPTVYQGNYSAVARKQEEVLFPTLRKLGMSFYAYSPMAGGFLAKSKADIEKGIGRFDRSSPVGQMYQDMYNKPSLLEVLAQWEEIAKEEGCSKGDLAYRWVKYNSPLKPENGDAIIIGASKFQQLEETLEGIAKGPLSDKAVQRIAGLWDTIKHEAPLDNYHR